MAREQLQLFGIDLGRLPATWLQGWREVADWPWVSRLVPRMPVEVHQADGSVTLRRGTGTETLRGVRPAAVALELPAEAVLLHSVRLPGLPDAELRSALELEVAALSPFAPEQTLWGWCAEPDRSGAVGTLTVTIAIAARTHVRERVAAAAARFAAGRPVEVWVRTSGRAIVLQGFDERVRRGLERRRLAMLVGQLVLAGVLFLALVATPVLQARQRVFDAQARFAELRDAVADDLRLRDALVQRKQQVELVRAHFGDAPELLGLLGRLTDLVPDDAFLSSFNWNQEGTVSVKGLATNAAALIEQVGAEPDLTLVRAPTAIARDRATRLETFSITFDLDATVEQ